MDYYLSNWPFKINGGGPGKVELAGKVGNWCQFGCITRWESFKYFAKCCPGVRTTPVSICGPKLLGEWGSGPWAFKILPKYCAEFDSGGFLNPADCCHSKNKNKIKRDSILKGFHFLPVADSLWSISTDNPNPNCWSFSAFDLILLWIFCSVIFFTFLLFSLNEHWHKCYCNEAEDSFYLIGAFDSNYKERNCKIIEFNLRTCCLQKKIEGYVC